MSGLGLGLWMGLGSQGGMRKIAAITRSILSQYAQTGTTEITIKRNVSTKDLIAIIPQVSPTISAGAKPLKFTHYTDNVRTLMDIPANENGNDTELLAWLIDELYANYVNVWINLQSVGVARDNIHVSGELPATFSIAAGFVDTGTKRINFSEPVTLTITGDVTLSIAGTPYQSGDTIPVASSYHELTINNPGVDAGTITFGKRKQITYLRLYNLGSSVITGDITGMKLTYLFLYRIGSSVITGDITGMELTLLYLYALGSSVITGDITGMELTLLYLYALGSSLTYGSNSLNITNNSGIQLLGDTVFTASEYIQLFADAATCVTDGKWTAATKILTISGGDNPGWSNVSTYYDTIVGGGVTVKVPLAWESGDDAFSPETQNP